MATVAIKCFHWMAAFLTVPFAVSAFFIANPEKVKYAKDTVAFPLPSRLVTFMSQFAHLTIISHELTSIYFVWSILRNHSIIKVQADSSADLWSEAFFSVTTAVALFVALVFWGAALIDVTLMAPIDLIFPTHLQFTDEFKRHLLFGAIFGPTDPLPDCAWQTHFRRFMQYVHSVCPLLLVADVMFVRHKPGNGNLEVSATGTFALCYIAWNMLCWWLLRVAPYPLQKRFYDLGIVFAVSAYVLLCLFVTMLCLYTRWMKSARSCLAVGLPVFLVVWASTGLAPFRGTVAQKQGIDPNVLFQGWLTSSRSAFLTEEAEEAYLAKRGEL